MYKKGEYPIQTVNIEPGDAILVYINDDLALNEAQEIHKMLSQEFPKNTILLSNEHILQGLAIIKKPKTNTIDTYYRDIDEIL